MMEIHIYRSASFVVATTNNKWIKTINFNNFTSKLRVGIKNYELVDNLQGKNMKKHL